MCEIENFNSRPREEVDKRWRGTETRTLISTHDLTRRSTRVAFRKNWKIKSFNSRPRKEVDWPSPTCHRQSRYFNSRPRKEVDDEEISSTYKQVISTHDLARMSTSRWTDLEFVLQFQLTTSQGGRRSQLVDNQ